MISYNEKARKDALARSGGICQFCGLAPAEEAHHWAEKYPRERKLIADDLIGLCQPCHQIATYIRRVARNHGDSAVHDFHTAFASVMGRMFG